jgi:hypothetical protein
VNFRKQATEQMKDRYLGMMQTVWSGAEGFLDGYYGRIKDEKAGDNTPELFPLLYIR